MSKFKVGDRVRAYDANYTVTGIIARLEPSIKIQDDHNTVLHPDCFHPKQCRRLKARSPKQRIYANKVELGGCHRYFTASINRESEEDLEFVEVRKKDK